MIVVVLLLAGCAGFVQKRAAQVAAARNAAYGQPRKAIWDEMYTLMSQEYSILSQSEAAGMIQTEWRIEQQGDVSQRRQIRLELVGNGPYRVLIHATLLQQVAGAEWRELDGKYYEDELYVLLHERLRLGATQE
jgi:uncharacterized lipoprotein YmbA